MHDPTVRAGASGLVTVEGGELTPTAKVRRRVIEEQYGELIDEMYDVDNPQGSA